jgi:deazaflavin-dependent oxidoreductase (nitroreductase family)
VNALGRAFNAIGGSLMARSGRVGILGTTGAKTGLPRQAAVAFVRRDDGTLLIGAGSPAPRGWTANLRANPAATFRIKGVEQRYRARLVGAEERDAALRELRAKMGAIAERTSWGELFVLEQEEAGR